MTRLASRLTNDGDLVLASSKYRDQSRNKADVLKRFADLLCQASQPRKQRVPTRPGRAAEERRLAEKKARGRLKKERGAVRGTRLEE